MCAIITFSADEKFLLFFQTLDQGDNIFMPKRAGRILMSVPETEICFNLTDITDFHIF